MEETQSAVSPTDATLLWRLDAEFSRSMALVYVYVAIVMVTGLLGNLLVAVVYVTKFKATTTRSFIVTLAVLDLVSCAVGMPLDLFNLSRNYTYFSDCACKIETAALSFPYFCSALLLVVVAADRYRKISHPLASQLSITGANRAILGCCVATFVCLAPFVFNSGTKAETVESFNITATQCSLIDSFGGTEFQHIYNGILGFLFLSESVVMVTLYLLILSKLRKHRSRSKTYSLPKLDVAPSTGVLSCEIETMTTPGSHVHRELSIASQYEKNQSNTSNDCHYDGDSVMRGLTVSSKNCDDSGDVSLDRLSENSSNEQEGEKRECKESRLEMSSEEMEAANTSDAIREDKEVQIESTVQGIKPLPDEDASTAALDVFCNARQEQKQRHEAIVRKTTSTLCLVTMAFVLSFFPFLVVKTLGDVESSVGHENKVSVAIGLFIRSTYLQSAVNPFIYGIRHPEFRERCRRLLRCLK